MKTAQEYFDLYGRDLCSEDDTVFAAAISSLITDLAEEFNQGMSNIPNSTTTAMDVLMRTNSKYNEIVSLFVQTYGSSPIVRDGFLQVIYGRMSEREKAELQRFVNIKEAY